MKKPVLCITLSALVAVLAGAAAYFLCRSSSDKPFVYHESWSPERRADIEQLQELMLQEQTKLMLQELPEQYDAKEEQRQARLIRKMLRRVAESGKGDIYIEEGFSAAHLAAHQSMPELLRELVLRGANPNAVHKSSPDFVESVFQTAISCVSLTPDTERLTQQERLELLGWLLEHGADVNLNSDYSLMLALMADMIDEWHHDELSVPGGSLEWLLDHGLTPQGERAQNLICMVIHQRGSLPCVRRLAQKGYLNLQDTQLLNTLLKNAITSPESDSAEKARWALALGAQPESAMQLCRSNILLYGDSDDAEDFAHYTATLQTLDALLDYGAELQDIPGLLPHDEPQKSLLLEMLEKHNLRP